MPNETIQILPILVVIILIVTIFWLLAKNSENNYNRRIDFEKRNKFVVEEERKRIQQELHDDISPQLVDIKRRLEYEDMNNNHVLLGQIIKKVDRVSTEIRTIMNKLYPAELDHLGFQEAIYALFEETLTGIHTEIEVIINNEDIIDKDVKLNAYRILQQIADNILKHSETEKVAIKITADNRQIEASIKDNGKGFYVHQVQLTKTGGLGLKTMKERAYQYGGTVKIFSKEAGVKGTQIYLNMPIKSKSIYMGGEYAENTNM